MTLENQVCSLELAKKLFDLEVAQESLFCWEEYEYGTHEEWKIIPTSEATPANYFSAFTVAELGEMLPKGYVSGISFYEDESKHAICHWYQVDTSGALIPELEENVNIKAPTGEFFKANTEADARAKMLVYLLENKLI